MASSLYTKGLQKILNGNVDVLTDDLKLVLIDTAGYTVDLDGDEFLSAIPSGDRISISPALGSKAVSIDTGASPDAVMLDCADTTFSSVTGDPTEAVALFKDTGDPATSPLLAYYDGSGVALTPNGNNVSCVISANGLFRLSR